MDNYLENYRYRVALAYGNQKINLHQLGDAFEPKTGHIQTGSADLSFILKTPISRAKSHLLNCGIEIIEGPISRTGATGPIVSLYFRDPDKNLIKVSNYENS